MKNIKEKSGLKIIKFNLNKSDL